jgi:hypothetical protein
MVHFELLTETLHGVGVLLLAQKILHLAFAGSPEHGALSVQVLWTVSTLAIVQPFGIPQP